jgi:RTX calcium-binding nonapeptide repeat (4 copies)
MLRGVSKGGPMKASGCAVIRQSHLIAVVGAFLFGCAVLLMVVGCAGVRSEAPQKEEQGRTEATKEQTRSPEATASEEARCSDAVEGTRTIKRKRGRITTNDVPGFPNKGGLLCGTAKRDDLDGKVGDDEIHGLGGRDYIDGGSGNDVIYGGPGDDAWLTGDDGDDVIYGGAGNEEEIYDGSGEDVIYGGAGNDFLEVDDRQRGDKLYCGEGWDDYRADKNDYVDSSCEKKLTGGTIIP